MSTVFLTTGISVLTITSGTLVVVVLVAVGTGLNKTGTFFSSTTSTTTLSLLFFNLIRLLFDPTLRLLLLLDGVGLLLVLRLEELDKTATGSVGGVLVTTDGIAGVTLTGVIVTLVLAAVFLERLFERDFERCFLRIDLGDLDLRRLDLEAPSVGLTFISGGVTLTTGVSFVVVDFTSGVSFVVIDFTSGVSFVVDFTSGLVVAN